MGFGFAKLRVPRDIAKLSRKLKAEVSHVRVNLADRKPGFPGQDSTSRQYPRKGILAIHRVPGPQWAEAVRQGTMFHPYHWGVDSACDFLQEVSSHQSPPKPEIITSPDHMKYIEMSPYIPQTKPPKYQITSIIIYPRIGVTTNGRGCCPAPLKIAEDLWNSSSRVHLCRGTLWWGTLPGHERTSGLGDSEHEKPDWTCFLRASILPVTSCYIRFLYIKILHVHFPPKKVCGSCDHHVPIGGSDFANKRWTRPEFLDRDVPKCYPLVI